MTTQETPEPGTAWETLAVAISRMRGDGDLDDIIREHRPAIEAEARAAVLAEVREGVVNMDPHASTDAYPYSLVEKRAVLALLDNLSDGGPT